MLSSRLGSLALRRALSVALLANPFALRSLLVWRIDATIELLDSLLPQSDHLRCAWSECEGFWASKVSLRDESRRSETVVFPRVEGLPPPVATAMQLAGLLASTLLFAEYNDGALSAPWWPRVGEEIVERDALGAELETYLSLLRVSYFWDREERRLLGLTLRDAPAGRKHLAAQWNRYLRERERDHIDGAFWCGAVARPTASGLQLVVGETPAIDVLDAWWPSAEHHPPSFVVAREVLRWVGGARAAEASRGSHL